VIGHRLWLDTGKISGIKMSSHRHRWHAQRCRQLFAVLISCHETDSAADRIWSCHLWMFMKRTMYTAALVMRIQAINRPIHCKHVTQFVSVHTCSHSSPPDWALRVIIVLGWVNFKVPDCWPPTGRFLALQITKFLLSSLDHFRHALCFLYILLWCVYISTPWQCDSVTEADQQKQSWSQDQ
jgi:hypothetical protein